MMYYAPKRDDSQVEQAIMAQLNKTDNQGFNKVFDRLRLEGYQWNHKRVYRVYRKMGLSIGKNKRKRLPARVKEPLEVPGRLNHTWSMDFLQDRLENGRKFRCFVVLDDANREALHVDIDHSLKSKRVIWVLNHLINRNGKPKRIRMDNGPEFIARILVEWAQAHQIDLLYIQPGRPMQNAYVERFNGSYRRGVLNAYLFESLEQVREQTHHWVHDYNHHRPHDSLKKLPPVLFAQKHLLGASPQQVKPKT
jgi:putative transposase